MWPWPCLVLAPASLPHSDPLDTVSLAHVTQSKRLTLPKIQGLTWCVSLAHVTQGAHVTAQAIRSVFIYSMLATWERESAEIGREIAEIGREIAESGGAGGGSEDGDREGGGTNGRVSVEGSADIGFCR